MAYGFNDDKGKHRLLSGPVTILGVYLSSFTTGYDIDGGASRVCVNAGCLQVYFKFNSAHLIQKTDLMFNVNPGYRPMSSYGVLSIRSATSPYAEIGTVWIDELGRARYYFDKIPTGGFYIVGNYTVEA